MVEHDALGNTRGAARVDEQRERAGSTYGSRVDPASTTFRRSLTSSTGTPSIGVERSGSTTSKRAAGVVELARDLAGGQARVDRRDGGAERQAANSRTMNSTRLVSLSATTSRGPMPSS